MKFRLIIRPQADIGIVEAAEYCEGEKAGLGLGFLDELEEAMNNLAEHPQFTSTPYRRRRNGVFY